MLPENASTRRSQFLARKQHASALSASQQHREQPPAPFWAEPLPLPPEVDFVGTVQQDLKVLAVLAAVNQIAKQRGNTIATQLDIWNYGRGAI